MEKRSSRRPPVPPPRPSTKTAPKTPEPAQHDDVARLEKRLAALEAEVAALKAAVHARRGPPPLPESDGMTIDVSDTAELIEPTRRSRA